jgi:hypothetical protein
MSDTTSIERDIERAEQKLVDNRREIDKMDADLRREFEVFERRKQTIEQNKDRTNNTIKELDTQIARFKQKLQEEQRKEEEEKRRKEEEDVKSIKRKEEEDEKRRKAEESRK